MFGGPGSSVGIATELRTGRSGDRIPVGTRFSAPVQTGPWAHPASCTMGTGSFPGVKSGRGVTMTPHLLLVPWSWKGRAIPLLPLWAVRPVQSLSACTRVHFTLPQCLYKGALYFYFTVCSNYVKRPKFINMLSDYRLCFVLSVGMCSACSDVLLFCN